MTNFGHGDVVVYTSGVFPFLTGRKGKIEGELFLIRNKYFVNVLFEGMTEIKPIIASALRAEKFTQEDIIPSIRQIQAEYNRAIEKLAEDLENYDVTITDAKIASAYLGLKKF